MAASWTYRKFSLSNNGMNDLINHLNNNVPNVSPGYFVWIDGYFRSKAHVEILYDENAPAGSTMSWTMRTFTASQSKGMVDILNALTAPTPHVRVLPVPSGNGYILLYNPDGADEMEYMTELTSAAITANDQTEAVTLPDGTIEVTVAISAGGNLNGGELRFEFQDHTDAWHTWVTINDVADLPVSKELLGIQGIRATMKDAAGATNVTYEVVAKKIGYV